MSVRGEGRIVNAVNQHFKYEDRAQPYVRTPRPGPPQNPEQELLLRMASLMRSPSFYPGEIVSGILSQNSVVQENMAEIVFRLVQRWSNMSQYVTNPANPLIDVYRKAAKMLPPEA